MRGDLVGSLLEMNGYHHCGEEQTKCRGEGFPSGRLGRTTKASAWPRASQKAKGKKPANDQLTRATSQTSTPCALFDPWTAFVPSVRGREGQRRMVSCFVAPILRETRRCFGTPTKRMEAWATNAGEHVLFAGILSRDGTVVSTG